MFSTLETPAPLFADNIPESKDPSSGVVAINVLDSPAVSQLDLDISNMGTRKKQKEGKTFFATVISICFDKAILIKGCLSKFFSEVLWNIFLTKFLQVSALFAEDVFIFLERERDKIALVGNTNSFAATLSYKRFSSKTSLLFRVNSYRDRLRISLVILNELKLIN